VRTQPYAAPYFFPTPDSPDAVDYVQRAREEHRLSQSAGNSLPGPESESEGAHAGRRWKLGRRPQPCSFHESDLHTTSPTQAVPGLSAAEKTAPLLPPIHSKYIRQASLNLSHRKYQPFA
jgi:hypothetical protein